MFSFSVFLFSFILFSMVLLRFVQTHVFCFLNGFAMLFGRALWFFWFFLVSQGICYLGVHCVYEAHGVHGISVYNLCSAYDVQ